jgi:hypothetical protein
MIIPFATRSFDGHFSPLTGDAMYVKAADLMIFRAKLSEPKCKQNVARLRLSLAAITLMSMPLLYILSLQGKNEPIKFFADRVTMGALSMRSLWIE